MHESCTCSTYEFHMGVPSRVYRVCTKCVPHVYYVCAISVYTVCVQCASLRLNNSFIRRPSHSSNRHLPHKCVVVGRTVSMSTRCRHVVKQVLRRQYDLNLTLEFCCYRSLQQEYFPRCSLQDGVGPTVVLRLIRVIRHRIAWHDRSYRQRRLGVSDLTSSRGRLRTDRRTEWRVVDGQRLQAILLSCVRTFEGFIMYSLEFVCLQMRCGFISIESLRRTPRMTW